MTIAIPAWTVWAYLGTGAFGLVVFLNLARGEQPHLARGTTRAAHWLRVALITVFAWPFIIGSWLHGQRRTRKTIARIKEESARERNLADL